MDNSKSIIESMQSWARSHIFALHTNTHTHEWASIVYGVVSWKPLCLAPLDFSCLIGSWKITFAFPSHRCITANDRITDSWNRRGSSLFCDWSSLMICDGGMPMSADIVALETTFHIFKSNRLYAVMRIDWTISMFNHLNIRHGIFNRTASAFSLEKRARVNGLNKWLDVSGHWIKSRCWQRLWLGSAICHWLKILYCFVRI